MRFSVHLTRGVLSNSRLNCQLTYWLEEEHITVDKRPGVAWMRLDMGSV